MDDADAPAGVNWAGNVRYRARAVAAPATVQELADLVRAEDRLRPLGTRHSFSRIADTDGLLVSVDRLPQDVRMDEQAGTVRVPAAMRYGTLARLLNERGWALANLASLPHISVAGAVATGTHGSGLRIGSLAAAVVAVELVDGTGTPRTFRRDADADFPGTVVALGALGVVTSLELAVEPTYRIAQHVYEALPLTTALDAFPEVMTAGYSVSLFTTWQDPATIDQLWLKRRESEPEPPPSLFGARAATGPRHPLPGISPESTTGQLGEPGDWLDRLPHFRMEHTPSAGDELQSEYLLPFRLAVPALRAVADLADRIAPLLQVSELRSVRADDLWLSPASGEDAVAIHFTWRPDQPAVTALLPELERALAPFDARPHWGKLSTVPAERLAELYPRLPDFRALADRLDPAGRFRSDYLRGTVFA